VRYDIRGHGRSGQPITEESYSSQRMVEDFQAVCKAFSIIKPFSVAWSVFLYFVCTCLMFFAN
jgi:pimeloyl-ACP methyl ester carboxylesterase